MSTNNQYDTKVIFCTATVGSGHLRAAQAVANHFKHSQIFNILNFTPKWFNKLYHHGYFFAVKYFPNIVGEVAISSNPDFNIIYITINYSIINTGINDNLQISLTNG